jgi:hypothetical protein
VTTTRTSRWLANAAQKLLLTLLILVAVMGVADAATQRMLLLPGSFSIAGGGSREIPARCLDHGSSTPGDGENFRFVPARLSSVKVSIAGGASFPLQQAIDNGDVAVEGVGNHRRMRIRNLSTDREVKVDIAKTSVVAPNNSYSVSDLNSLEVVGNTSESLEQDDVWVAVKRNAADQLGIENPDFATGETNDAYRMLTHAEWIKSNPARPAAHRAFVVHRSIPQEGAQPIYYLFTGQGPVQQFKGNQQLPELAAQVRKLWGKTPGRPRLVLAGKGSIEAFDAARLTIELSPAAGGGGRDGTDNLASGGFDFEPPKGALLRDVYDGKPWNNLLLTTDRPSSRLRSDQKFGDRGNVTAFSKTRVMLSYMTSAIRRIVSDKRNATSPRATIEMFLKNGVRFAAESAIASDPGLREEEEGKAEVVWDIDGQTGSQYVVSIRFAPGPDGLFVHVSTREASP